MIDKLTREQKEKVGVYQRKWFGQFHGLVFDEVRAKKLVGWLYGLLGKPVPMVVILDSPLAVQLAVNLLNGCKNFNRKLGSPLYGQLSDKLNGQLSGPLYGQLSGQLSGPLYGQLSGQLSVPLYGQLLGPLYEQLREQLSDQLNDKLSEQLSRQLREQLKDLLNDNNLKFYGFDFWGNTSDFGWVCFYDYLYEELFPDVKISLFEKYRDLIKANINFLVTFEGIAFISKPPVFINFDDRNRLHCKSDAAVCYGDGYKEFFVDGVHFGEVLFNKVFKDGNVTSEEVLGLENAEQKAVVIKHLGFEKIFSDLKSKELLDKQKRSFNKNPKLPVIYELFKSDIGGLSVCFVKVEWWEKGYKRQTVLGVPNNMVDVIEAVAWTCYKSKDEYERLLLVEA